MTTTAYLYIITVAMNLVFAYYDDLHGRFREDAPAERSFGYSLFMLLLCFTGPAAIVIYSVMVSLGGGRVRS